MKLGLHLVINFKQAVVQGLQQVHLCNGRQTSYIANIKVQNPEGCLTLNINNTKNYIFIRSWCPGPESNRHAQKARDFKSLVSTNFTTRADGTTLETA